MHRTEGDNHSANSFTDGPPGTTVEENWLNAVQEELCNVITAASITLKTAATESQDQLLTALQTLFLQKTGAIGKNALINGDFRVSQRGTSGTAAYTAATTPANNDDTYLHDRWLLLSDGNDIVDVSQSTEAPDGFLLSCALDVETVNKKFGIFQPIEQKNCQHLVDETVSLSFYAKVSDITKLDNIKAMIVSWDGAADTITSDIISAWNAEDTTPTLVANWTAENTPSNLGVTASWVKYSIPNVSIDTAGAKNIGVFIWSDGFCDTVATFLYITGVQLEKNTVASDYEWRNITDELIKCQRYFCKSYDQDTFGGVILAGAANINIDGVANSDHNIQINCDFPVTMRSTPSITLYDLAGAADKVTMSAGDGKAATVSGQSDKKFIGSGSNGAVAVARYLSFSYVASIEL